MMDYSLAHTLPMKTHPSLSWLGSLASDVWPNISKTLQIEDVNALFACGCAAVNQTLSRSKLDLTVDMVPVNVAPPWWVMHRYPCVQWLNMKNIDICKYRPEAFVDGPMSLSKTYPTAPLPPLNHLCALILDFDVFYNLCVDTDSIKFPTWLNALPSLHTMILENMHVWRLRSVDPLQFPDFVQICQRVFLNLPRNLQTFKWTAITRQYMKLSCPLTYVQHLPPNLLTMECKHVTFFGDLLAKDIGNALLFEKWRTTHQQYWPAQLQKLSARFVSSHLLTTLPSNLEMLVAQMGVDINYQLRYSQLPSTLSVVWISASNVIVTMDMPLREGVRCWSVPWIDSDSYQLTLGTLPRSLKRLYRSDRVLNDLEQVALLPPPFVLQVTENVLGIRGVSQQGDIATQMFGNFMTSWTICVSADVDAHLTSNPNVHALVPKFPVNAEVWIMSEYHRDTLHLLTVSQRTSAPNRINDKPRRFSRGTIVMPPTLSKLRTCFEHAQDGSLILPQTLCTLELDDRCPLCSINYSGNDDESLDGELPPQSSSSPSSSNNDTLLDISNTDSSIPTILADPLLFAQCLPKYLRSLAIPLRKMPCYKNVWEAISNACPYLNTLKLECDTNAPSFRSGVLQDLDCFAHLPQTLTSLAFTSVSWCTNVTDYYLSFPHNWLVDILKLPLLQILSITPTSGGNLGSMEHTAMPFVLDANVMSRSKNATLHTLECSASFGICSPYEWFAALPRLLFRLKLHVVIDPTIGIKPNTNYDEALTRLPKRLRHFEMVTDGGIDMQGNKTMACFTVDAYKKIPNTCSAAILGWADTRW